MSALPSRYERQWHEDRHRHGAGARRAPYHRVTGGNGMRIGIDVSWAQGPPSGTATYIQGLVEALVRLGTQHEWILFERGQSAGRGRALPEVAARNVSRAVVDAPLTNLRQQVTLPLDRKSTRLNSSHV